MQVNLFQAEATGGLVSSSNEQIEQAVEVAFLTGTHGQRTEEAVDVLVAEVLVAVSSEEVQQQTEALDELSAFQFQHLHDHAPQGELLCLTVGFADGSVRSHLGREVVQAVEDQLELDFGLLCFHVDLHWNGFEYGDRRSALGRSSYWIGFRNVGTHWGYWFDNFRSVVYRSRRLLRRGRCCCQCCFQLCSFGIGTFVRFFAQVIVG
ncbi:hypothetical protein D3C86_1470380 [compost metagenome]